MSSGDTSKVFVGEYRVEAVRGEAGDLAGVRLHLDANILLKLLTDPAEPAHATLELVGVDGARTVTARAFALPDKLAARSALALGAGVFGLGLLVWIIVALFSSQERAVDWQPQPNPSAISAPQSTPPPAPVVRVPPVVEAPATPPVASSPIRLVPEPTAPSPRPALAPKTPPNPGAVAQVPAARAPKAGVPARQVPVAPAPNAVASSASPSSSVAIAAAPARPATARPANVLDLFDDTK